MAAAPCRASTGGPLPQHSARRQGARAIVCGRRAARAVAYRRRLGVKNPLVGKILSLCDGEGRPTSVPDAKRHPFRAGMPWCTGDVCRVLPLPGSRVATCRRPAFAFTL